MANEPTKKPSDTKVVTVAKFDIRIGKKAYAPGEELPNDLDDKTLAELRQAQAI